ncbi:MAG: ferrous iron transport protein A [Oscillospiraceae bacterium]|nr:ferrous iron transport protein A [Oscillospiraceae bacterium]
MPLTMAPNGVQTRVKKINGRDETKRFLENLGFTEGAVLTVISELGGNMIINIKDTRIAIDKTMANRIIVEQ